MALWCWNVSQFWSREISLTHEPSDGCQKLWAKSAALWNYKITMKTLKRFYSMSRSHTAFRTNITHVSSYHSALPLDWRHRTDRTRLLERARGGHRKRWFQKASTSSSPEDSPAARETSEWKVGEKALRRDPSVFMRKEVKWEIPPLLFIKLKTARASGSRTLFTSTHVDRLQVWINKSPFLVLCDWPKMFYVFTHKKAKLLFPWTDV